MPAPPPFVSVSDVPVAPRPVRMDAGKVLALLDRALDAQERRLIELRARIERLERSAAH